MHRALYRSSMGEIEHVLGPIVKGKRIIVEGHLSGTGRTAIGRLGAEVEELRLEDERRYVDMTAMIFVLAAVAMAVRYVSLGLDDQSLYILAGIACAVMYGLRPFFFKMQRPKDELGRLVKVATHIVFSEFCLFSASAVFDFPYETLFSHRSFLHGLLALALVTNVLGLPLLWIVGDPAPAVAVFVGYGSHLLADMMTLGGVQLFWPSRLIAVFPGRDEYRVVSRSETVFVAVVFILALLFYPVSRVGFDGLIYRMGGSDQVYGKVTKVTDGDTVSVEVYGQVQPVRLIGVDTPETVAPDQPVGCYGKEASRYTNRTLTDRLVRLEIPRIGDSEDAYGRTLAYLYLDADKDGAYEHLYNEDLITLGLARTTTFSHAHRREFERLREAAEERGAGLLSACPGTVPY